MKTTVRLPQAKEPWDAREKLKQRLLQGPRRERGPADTLSLDLWPPGLWEDDFCSKPPGCGYSMTAAPGSDCRTLG